MRTLMVGTAVFAVLVSAGRTRAQTFEEFGTWSYVRASDGSEVAYTESVDEDRTFSLAVSCEDGEPVVELEYLLASPGDDIGLDPDQFAPDGRAVTAFAGMGTRPDTFSFDVDSEWFVHSRPARYLNRLEGATRVSATVWNAAGDTVGQYTFDVRGADDVVDVLTCYSIG